MGVLDGIFFVKLTPEFIMRDPLSLSNVLGSFVDELTKFGGHRPRKVFDVISISAGQYECDGLTLLGQNEWLTVVFRDEFRQCRSGAMEGNSFHGCTLIPRTQSSLFRFSPTATM